VALDRPLGKVQDLSCLPIAQPDEKPQFDDLGFQGICSAEAIERIMDGQQTIVIGRCDKLKVVGVDTLLAAAVAEALSAARRVR
jgi:hypothetical protein